MDQLPEAELLLTLLAVAEGGSESAAAQALGIGQSSVSRRLAALQQLSSEPLTVRTASGTRPTEAGERLLPHARSLRSALATAQRLMAHAPTGTSGLELGISQHLTPRLTGALLALWRASHSAAGGEGLSFREAGSRALLEAVRAGQLDAALTLWAPAGSEPGYRAVRVGEERLSLIAASGHPAVVAGRVQAAELAKAPLLLPPASSVLHARALALTRRGGLDPASVQTVGSAAAVRTAVLSGAGVGVSVASYCSAETAAGWLNQASLTPEDEPLTVWLLLSDALGEAGGAGVERLVRDALGGSGVAP